MAVRDMAQAHYRRLLAQRHCFGMMEEFYEQHPLNYDDPESAEAAREDWEAYHANEKQVEKFDRIQARFLGQYERALRRLRQFQKDRRVADVRIQRAGNDRVTGAPIQKGVLHDTSFGLFRLQ